MEPYRSESADDVRFRKEIQAFLLSVLRRWRAVAGAVAGDVVLVFAQGFGAAIPIWLYIVILVGGILAAFFLVWRDEYRRAQIAEKKIKIQEQRTKEQEAYDAIGRTLLLIQERIYKMDAMDVSRFGEEPEVWKNEASRLLWEQLIANMAEFGPGEVAILSDTQTFANTRAPGDWGLIERGNQFHNHIRFLKFIAAKGGDFLKRTPRPTPPAETPL